ncbi:MAG: MaoC-like dehydratase [Gammaproteobacteria bacterium]|jgi:acyl dehydratase|nr:acyl dehydratase [Gammaproteobacteria bacterium]GIS32966.1 MAG: MaoC-like dehydratase [Gammaproteobacteria bacterium]|tara:strand:- start:496 stop:915 length:420 start_codon:yes stop_codon:yes gene_type:complete
MLKKSEIKIGDSHKETLVEDLKRTQIVQYAGSSGDYNPLHTDEVFTTKIAGYPSVFAHGMLTMGMTGKMITNYVGDGTLKKYGVRFTSQVWPGDTLESEAKIVDIREENGENLVDLEIVTTNQDGVAVITGSATAKIDS